LSSTASSTRRTRHGLVTAFERRDRQDAVGAGAAKEEAAGEPTRGLDFWQSGADRRLVAIRGEYLYALDAKTGKPAADFGTGGRVALHFSRSAAAAASSPTPPARSSSATSSSSPATPTAPATAAAKKERARDDIRGFSVRTGKLLWTFHVVPQAGEPGADTWGNESWKYAGDLGAWNPLSATTSSATSTCR
jgi:quinoprotein glucose dehydrogenase